MSDFHVGDHVRFKLGKALYKWKVVKVYKSWDELVFDAEVVGFFLSMGFKEFPLGHRVTGRVQKFYEVYAHDDDPNGVP